MTEQTESKAMWNMNVGAGEVFFDAMEKGIIDGGISDIFLARDLTEYFCEVNDDRILDMKFIEINLWEEKQYLGKDDCHFFTKDFDSCDGYFIHYVDLELTFSYVKDGVRYTLRSFGSIDLNKDTDGILKEFQYLRTSEKIIAARPAKDSADTILDAITKANEQVA